MGGRAWIDEQGYQQLYERSITDPDGFWGEIGQRIDWIKPYTRVKNTSFEPHNVSIKWFEDGTLNVVRQLHRPASGDARRPGRHHLGGRRPDPATRRSPTASCTSACASSPTC